MAMTAAVMGMTASPLTPGEALARLSSDPQGARMLPGKEHPQLLRTIKTQSDAPAVYIFAQGDDRLLLVGGDDLAEPIVGYIDSSATGEMPPQLEWWLSEYAREIEYVNSCAASGARAQSPADPNVNQAHPYVAPRAIRPPVSRFVYTRWNQDSPYNDLCPTVSGKHCMTGCTATAAAQVMKHFNYPEHGTGVKTYTPNVNQTGATLYKNQLTLDMSTVTFDWDNMLMTYDNTATTAQTTAVATLMKAVGYVAEMNYGTGSSGASTATCVNGMQQYFGYNSKAAVLDRQAFARDVWEDMVYNNIKTVGPVLYSGFNLTSAGHAFVCDAYDGGYFHFNWGWGGSYDGWFKLTALTPAGEGIGGNGSGDYSFDQNAAFNITRPTGATIELDTHQFTFSGNVTGSVADDKFTMTTTSSLMLKNNLATTNVTGGIKIVAEDGTATYKRWIYAASNLPTGYYFHTIDIWLPTLADGTYKLYPVAMGEDDTEYQNVYGPVGAVNYVTVTVNDGEWTVSDVPAPKLEITDVKLLTPFYLFTDFKLSYTVSNNSDIEILDGIQPYFYTKSSAAPAKVPTTAGTNMVAVGDGVLYDLTPGESQPTTQVTGMTCYTGTVPSGQIYLGLRSAGSGEILVEKPITLGNKPAAASLALNSFSFDGDSDHADANNLEFNINVTCKSGYQAAPLGVWIFPAGGGSSLAHLTSDDVFLSANQSESTVISGAFPQGKINTQYFAMPATGSTQLGNYNNYQYFTVGTVVAGVESVTEDEDEGAKAFFVCDRQTGMLTVMATAPISTVDIYTLDGRMQSLPVSIDGENAGVSVSALPSGVAIVKVTMADGSIAVEKFVK